MFLRMIFVSFKDDLSCVRVCFVLSFSLTVCQWHLRSVGFGENSHVRVRCPSLPKPVSCRGKQEICYLVLRTIERIKEVTWHKGSSFTFVVVISMIGSGRGFVGHLLQTSPGTCGLEVAEPRSQPRATLSQSSTFAKITGCFVIGT